MSVYTPVTHATLVAWLQPFSLGALLQHDGIAAGMQNSNYFVTSEQGRYVLTLFEHHAGEEIDVYLRLLDSLAQRGIPCPQPCRDETGRFWRPLAGKPAALFSCLAGMALDDPTPAHCRQLGRYLAQLHLAAADCADFPANPCGPAWRQAVGSELLPLVSTAERALLIDELDFQQKQAWTVEVGQGLPAGVIHGDLFRDNVLWDAHGRLSGILDFYFAGVDAWLFDLAVVVNDWCPDGTRLMALIDGYAAVRPLTACEYRYWPAVQRAAALRFWLLRLDAFYRPRDGEVVTRKDPGHFARLLQQLRSDPVCLPGEPPAPC